jgi:hypothetical protein
MAVAHKMSLDNLTDARAARHVYRIGCALRRPIERRADGARNRAASHQAAPHGGDQSDRPAGAASVSHHIMPVSHRSLESWPLPWQHVHGKAITPTIALFALAYSKLKAAPVVMGGRRVARTHHSEQVAA